MSRAPPLFLLQSTDDYISASVWPTMYSGRATTRTVSTGRFATNPARLHREIRRRFGRRPMGYEIPVSKDTRQLEAMRRECVEGAATMRWLRESVPAPLQHAIARAVPVEVRDWVVSREVTGGLDWSRTPGFAPRSDLWSFVRLNLAGRERQGMLEPGSEAHRGYVDHVMRSLLELRAEGTDQAIVRDVVPTQEVLPGALQGGLPRLAHNGDFARFTSHLLEVRSARAHTGARGGG